jgi:hypothetical protein
MVLIGSSNERNAIKYVNLLTYTEAYALFSGNFYRWYTEGYCFLNEQ